MIYDACGQLSGVCESGIYLVCFFAYAGLMLIEYTMCSSLAVSL